MEKKKTLFRGFSAAGAAAAAGFETPKKGEKQDKTWTESECVRYHFIILT